MKLIDISVINCPYCNSDITKVRTTNRRKLGVNIRYMQCKKCDKRWITSQKR